MSLKANGPSPTSSHALYDDNATEQVSHGPTSKGCCCHILKLHEFACALPGSRFLYHILHAHRSYPSYCEIHVCRSS